MESLSVLLVLLLLVALSSLFMIAEKIESENRMLSMSIETSQMYNKVLGERMQKIRRFRHDAVGLLQAIDAYDLDAEGEIAALSAVAGHAADAPSGASAGSDRSKSMPLLEAIIELKRRQSAEAGIDFACPEDVLRGIVPAAKIPGKHMGASEFLPDETDLCILVQNLLDNAYEAGLRITDHQQRRMGLDMRLESDLRAGTGSQAGEPSLLIEVTNSIDSQEKVTFLTRKNHPEFHGIGLRIVDDIVKKYRGSRTINVDQEACIFSITVRL